MVVLSVLDKLTKRENIIYVLLNRNGLYLAYSGQLVKEPANAMQFESWQGAETWRKGLWLKQNFVARKVN